MVRTGIRLRLLLPLATILTVMTDLHAQVRCVIADMETRVPIRNVKIFTDKGDVYVTDYTGQLKIDKPFVSANVSHVSYLERKARREEMHDTLYLLPKENTLNTLYVWGKERQRIKSLAASAVADAANYAPAGGIVSFDFFSMFEKKPLNKKMRKKNKNLLDNWDKLYGKVEEEKKDSTLLPEKGLQPK